MGARGQHLMKDLEPEDPAKLYPQSWPTEAMICICYFNPLSFGLIYYDGIDNQHTM